MRWGQKMDLYRLRRTYELALALDEQSTRTLYGGLVEQVFV